MSGREAIKGFGFQTQVMLLCCLEHCVRCDDFYMVGEPAANLDTGNFVDFTVYTSNNGRPQKKKIQVKKTINSTKAKEVINAFLQDLIKGDQVELWFADYVLENKMSLIEAYDNLIQALCIPNFAENEIRGKLGSKEIIIRIDGSIPTFSFSETTLVLHGIEVLNGTDNVNIQNRISNECGESKNYVLSKIKNYLNETLVYRRHIFLEELDAAPNIREEILKRGYDFFHDITIRRISETELPLKIKELIPHPYTADQKELLQDILFSFFYRKSSDGMRIDKSEVDGLISRIAVIFGHPPGIIDWSKKGVYGSSTPSLVASGPAGDFSMGGGQ